MRRSTLERNTKETQIHGSLRIEGQGTYNISTGIRFLDHMLELFAKHGGFDLTLKAAGDLDVDQHHTVEDCGIVLGQLFSQALGDRRGINRAGYFVLPMDETSPSSRSIWAAVPRWSIRIWSRPAWSATCKPNCWRISSAAS